MKIKAITPHMSQRWLSRCYKKFRVNKPQNHTIRIKPSHISTLNNEYYNRRNGAEYNKKIIY